MDQLKPINVENNEEEAFVRRKLDKKNSGRQSRIWNFLGRRVPKSQIVFICQMVVIYVVIAVSLFNLTSTTERAAEKHLWIALLSSCLGYVLPNPSIDPSTPKTEKGWGSTSLYRVIIR